MRFLLKSNRQELGPSLREALRPIIASTFEQASQASVAIEAYGMEFARGRLRRDLMEMGRIIAAKDTEQVLSKLEQGRGLWSAFLGAFGSEGDVDEMLRDFFEEVAVERIERRPLASMSIYVIFLSALAMAIILFLSVMVIPTFRDMFESFGLELPFLTLAMLQISRAFETGIVILWLVVGVILWWWGRLAINRLSSGVLSPVVDLLPMRFARSRPIAQFTRISSFLLQAGASKEVATRVAGRLVGRPRLYRAAERFADYLQSTDPLRATDPLQSARDSLSPADHITISSSVIYALEKAGSSENASRLLQQLSANYRDRRLGVIGVRSIWGGQIAIFAVGVVILLTILGLFLPLVNLIQGLT